MRPKIDMVQLAQRSVMYFSSQLYTLAVKILKIFHHRLPWLTKNNQVIQSHVIMLVKVIRDAFSFCFVLQNWFNWQMIHISFEIHTVNQYLNEALLEV